MDIAAGRRAHLSLAVRAGVHAVSAHLAVLAGEALSALANAVRAAGSVATAVFAGARSKVATSAIVALLALAQARLVAGAVAGARQAVGSRAVGGLAAGTVEAGLALALEVRALAVLVAVARAVLVLALLTNKASVTHALAHLALALTAGRVGAQRSAVSGFRARDARPALIALANTAQAHAIGGAVLVLRAVVSGRGRGAVIARETLNTLAHAAHADTTDGALGVRAVLQSRAVVVDRLAGVALVARVAHASAVRVLSVAVALSGAGGALPALVALANVAIELVLNAFALLVAVLEASSVFAVDASKASVALASAIVAHAVAEAIASALLCRGQARRGWNG